MQRPRPDQYSNTSEEKTIAMLDEMILNLREELGNDKKNEHVTDLKLLNCMSDINLTHAPKIIQEALAEIILESKLDEVKYNFKLYQRLLFLDQRIIHAQRISDMISMERASRSKEPEQPLPEATLGTHCKHILTSASESNFDALFSELLDVLPSISNKAFNQSLQLDDQGFIIGGELLQLINEHAGKEKQRLSKPTTTLGDQFAILKSAGDGIKIYADFLKNQIEVKDLNVVPTIKMIGTAYRLRMIQRYEDFLALAMKMKMMALQSRSLIAPPSLYIAESTSPSISVEAELPLSGPTELEVSLTMLHKLIQTKLRNLAKQKTAYAPLLNSPSLPGLGERLKASQEEIEQLTSIYNSFAKMLAPMSPIVSSSSSSSMSGRVYSAPLVSRLTHFHEPSSPNATPDHSPPLSPNRKSSN